MAEMDSSSDGEEEKFINSDYKDFLSKKSSFGRGKIGTVDFGSEPAKFILDEYIKKIMPQDKCGEEFPNIRRFCRASVRKFAPAADIDTADTVVQLVSLKTLENIKADQQSERFRGFKQSNKVDIENMGGTRDEKKKKDLQGTRTLDVSEIFSSARDLLKEKQEFLDVSCPLLNQLLGGGLRRGAITEICGASSSGKTQVCLHSTASIVLQGKPVVYLQTEGGGFPINRLEQMIQQREKMTSSSRASTSTSCTASSTTSASSSILSSSLDRVLVQKVVNYTQLERILDTELESIIKEKGVVLVIIDSIAAILRGDSDIKDMHQRSNLIHRIGGRLKDISLNLNISILVVNQVSAAIDYHGFTGGRTVVPALGYLWTNYINTRLFLTKTDFVVSSSALPCLISDTTLRCLEVDFSSDIPEDFINFVLLPSGISGIRITE